MSEYSESGSGSESESESDSSIYNEIEELIATTVQQQLAYEESITALERIQNSIDTKNIMYATYCNNIVDFNDIIDKFHSESLETIDNSGNVTFGQLLLEFLKGQASLNKID
jgi:hypothetical protein